MSLSKQEIQHIASLARLSLEPKEEEQFQTQLSSILEYVSQLQEVPSSEAEYEYPVETLRNVMDSDTIRPSDEQTRKQIIESFPKRVADLLKVKGVFHE